MILSEGIWVRLIFKKRIFSFFLFHSLQFLFILNNRSQKLSDLVIYKDYQIFFFHIRSLISPRSWYIRQRAYWVKGWYQNPVLMRDLIWKRPCYSLFIIYLAQEDITRDWQITHWYWSLKGIWYIPEPCD